MFNLINHQKRSDYHFKLDQVDFNLAGWFIPKKQTGNLYIRLNGTEEILQVVCNINRPGVDKLYKNTFDYAEAGFRIKITDNKFKNGFQLLYKDEDREEILYDGLPCKPILYVHIAKTAGSTVNTTFKELYKNQAMVHVESNPDWTKLTNEYDYKFISGHIPYEEFKSKLNVDNYTKAISFRDPIKHVISHIAWIRLLAEPSEKIRFEAHPPYIQELALKMQSFDLSDDNEIRQLIQSLNQLEFNLLENCQVRYIRKDIEKPKVDSTDVKDALKNLKKFDFIGLDNNIDGFISGLMLSHGQQYINNGRRENVKDDKFGLDATNKKHINALNPLIKYDLSLYKKISKPRRIL